MPVLLLAATLFYGRLTDHNPEPPLNNPDSFKQIASIDLGGTAASEISAYDPFSKRLLTVNNESAAFVEVIDLSAFPAVTKLPSINMASLGGVANSAAVWRCGTANLPLHSKRLTNKPMAAWSF